MSTPPMTPTRMRRGVAYSGDTTSIATPKASPGQSVSAPTSSQLKNMLAQQGAESFKSTPDGMSFKRSPRRASIADLKASVGTGHSFFTGAATFRERLVSPPVPINTLPWLLAERSKNGRTKPAAARALDVEDKEVEELQAMLSSERRREKGATPTGM